MSFVLDTSVSLAWCFADERTPPVMALLDRAVETGGYVPQLWPIECLNGLLSAERRRRITSTQRESLLGFLHELPLEIDAETADRVWQATQMLAARHGLTAYDATYLELAMRMRVPLASADRALINAAAQCGVTILPTA